MPDLEALYAANFLGGDLRPLIRALAQLRAVLSLVTLVGPDFVAHVAFTRCRIAGQPDAVAPLGPMAVVPLRQRQGMGGSVLEGLRRLAAQGRCPRARPGRAWLLWPLGLRGR